MSQMPPPPPPPPGGFPPPPPPPPGGQPAPDMSGPFQVGEAISRGWNLYWQNVGQLLVITLVVIGIDIVVGIIRAAAGSGILALLLGVVSYLVSLVLGLGIARAALAVAEGRRPEVGMLFITDGWGPVIGAGILFGIGVGIGLVLLIVPGVILLIMWYFYAYVIADDPTTGPTDALRRSADITRGHRWPLLGFALLLLGINIIGFIACCVGLLFTIGISAVATACAYKTLSAEGVRQP